MMQDNECSKLNDTNKMNVIQNGQKNKNNIKTEQKQTSIDFHA